MAENMFERYRPAASPGISDDNQFKQFAPRPTPAASPAAPVAKKPERTWGQAAKDTALGVAQGAVNLVGGLADAQEAASPTGIINTAVGLAKRAVPNLDIRRVPDLSNTVSLAAGKVLGADSMPTTAEATGAATQAITGKLSPALQQEKQELSETEGFIDSAKKVITSPKLLSQFTAEQVPNLLALGAGSRVSAVQAAEGVVGRALAGGATREAAEAAGQAAANRGAVKFITAANPIMEGGAASQQAQQDAMQLPEETWQKDPSYQAMLASGVDPLTAKRELSQNAGAAARLIGGAAGYVGGKIAAPFEADVFTRQLARKPVAMLAGAGREAAEEGIQEGGSQLGSNVGVQTIDPTRETTAGVGQAAGIGSTLGAVMGGGLALGGAATSKKTAARPQPTVATAPPPLPAGPITRAADPAAVDVVVPAARPFPQAAPGSIADVANLVPAAPPPLPEPAPAPTDEEIRASRPDSGNPSDPGYIRVQHDVAKQTMQKERIAQQLRDAKKSGDESALATALEEQRAYRTSVLRTDTIHDRIDQIKHKDDAEARAELESLNGELDKRRAVSTESEDLSTGTGESSTAPAAPVAPAPPWVNPETGEMREPADREIEEVMHNLINQATAGGGGINTPVMRKVLTEQMGLTSARIQPLMAKVKADRKKGLTAPADLEQQLVDQVRETGRPEPAPVEEAVVAQPAPAATEKEPHSQEGADQALETTASAPVEVASAGVDRTAIPADTAPGQAQPSVDLQYDESPELLDSDITTPSGGSFSSKGAAEATAKRHDGARVFALEDGTFTVRTPAQAVADTDAPVAPTQAREAVAPAPLQTTPQAANSAAGQSEQTANTPPPETLPAQEPQSSQGESSSLPQGTPAGEVAQAAAPATLDDVAHQAATSDKNDIPHPTDAQKEAGNYRKGHARLAGLDVSIENPAGSRRRPEWPPLKNHYGYFKGSIGADKDHVDVFMTDKADDASLPVFVVDQRHKNGRFDEHKVVLGATNEAEARATYLQNYEKGWAGLQGITQMSQDEFKAWIKDPAKTTKPAAGKVNTGRAVVQPKPKRAAAANDPITPSVIADIPAPAKRSGTAVVAPKPKRQPVEARQDPPAPAAAITDVGEKIGGARKDVWKDRGLQLSDLDGMTGGEQAMFTNKDNVWKPDFGKQIDTGMEPLAAAAAKLMWGRVPKEPYSDTDQGRREYVKALGMIRGILEKAKTLDDLRTAGDRFQVMTGEVVSRYGGWIQARAAAPVYTAAWGQSGNSFKPFGWQYKDESKARELLDKGWPGESGWRSKYRIREGFLRLPNGERGEKFLVRDRAKNGVYHGNTIEGYATRAEAEAVAAELFAGRKADPKNVVKDPPRPHLDNIPRIGNDHRAGRDVAAEDFRSAFGFRGVEFGNWAAQDERQKLINLAYDGLMDMANVLGVPPAAISLDGTLGLALGARGKGKAAAHYEPGKVVINMTKISGAGALAHEWGHAMDHYFGEFGQDKPYGGLGKYASGGRGKPTLHTPEAFARLRPEMQTAWRDVLRSIYENRIDKAEKVRELELHGEQLDARIEAMQEAGSKDPTAVGALAVMKNRRLAVKNELDFARGEPDDTTWTKGQSDVLAALTKEGMGEYWKRPTELLARSFEAYVNAKIKDAGDKSQYLVSVPAHPAWPQGKQLAAVSKAFGKFFDVVQTKQTPRGTALFSMPEQASTEPFYSALDRAAKDGKGAPKKGTREQWIQWLDGAQRRGEFKQEERDWTGVDAWLDGQESVTREQLQAYVRANAVQVTETTLSEAKLDPTDLMERDEQHLIALARAEPGNIFKEELARRDIRLWHQEDISKAELADRLGLKVSDIDRVHARSLEIQEAEGPTQFAQYQLPGGQNYRELLLTLPAKSEGEEVDHFDAMPGEPTSTTQYGDADFQSSHFEQPNILAHVRFNERTDADGKKVLFLEEVQSDWHQAGRKEGYATAPNGRSREAISAEMNTVLAEIRTAPNPGLEAKFEALKAEYWHADRDRLAVSGVPDAPFKTTWPMLAMKRMVRYAAENGFDRIAWTTGEQQAERYDLSKQISSIYAKRDTLRDGYELTVTNNDGVTIFDNAGYAMDPAQLESHVGKEMADRIMKELPNAGDKKNYTGLGLKVGGEGMRGFYDKILPNEVNKFAKRFGGKVGTGSIISNTSPQENLGSANVEAITAFHDISGAFWNRLSRQEQNELTREYLNERGKPEPVTVHSLDVTPAMREAALQGLPMFSRAGRVGSDRAPWTGFPDVDIASPFGPGQVRLSAQEGYAAAKAGDNAAALAVTEGYVTPELVDRYKALIGDTKPIVVPVMAEEASGANKIPLAFAERLAHRLGLDVSTDILQSVRAHHTAAGAYARIGNQAAFDGPVKAGQTYLILDDAVTMGGTLANLRGHIEANGGLVVGAGVLSGHPNSASIPIKAATEQRLREDFGDELQTYLQDEFGFGIQHLTEGEAAQIRSARTLDELRARIAQARHESVVGRNEGNALRSEVNEGPRDAGLSTSGLPMARAQELKTELTKDWGDNGPSVILVASAEDFPDSAKVDPGYARAEGLYDGRPMVWLNVGQLRTEARFAQVLAHEAIGHYGVERVVGEKEWESIVDAIAKLDGSDATSQALKDVFADVRKRYGDLDRTTFAKEAIAVMAERGIRNSFVARLIAAVRRFLRRVMPSRTWSEADVLDLLSQSDSFLRAGRNAEERAATVQAYSFSRAQIDGAGQRFVDQNGGRFVQRGDQWYLAGKDGQPRDFLTLGEATAEAERTGGRIEADPNDGARRTWSVTLPGGAELTQQANAVLFSRPAVLDDLDAVRASLESSSVLDRAKQLIKDLTPGKVKDAGRQTWLAALTTRHLTELGQDYFSNIKHYSDFLAEMQADRNALQADAEGLAESARKWAGKNRTEAAAMFDVMHEATIDGVDPAEDYKPLEFKFSGKNHVVTPKSIKEALAALRQMMRERSGDNKTDMINEAKVLRGMPARERARAKKYAPLVVKFNALSPEAQQLYREMRDKYSNRSDQVEQALIARIKDTDADEGHKRKIIDVIRQQFESNRLQGVYFPLQRFGKYFVAAEKDGVPTFQMFEKLSDLSRAEKGLRDRGFTINGRGLKDQGKAKDAPSGTFVAEVMEKLNRAGVSDKTQDEIYQIYLQSLPEMSMRKHAIHRKSIPGFDPDGLRAFAYNMHHGSHQLARLRFGHKLTAVIGVLKQQQKNLAKDPGSDTQKIVAGDAILQELDKRHEWIMNPTDSQVTNLISSAGFAYYLGLTPAASLVNLTQNALVTFPYLAARFGGIKAMNYMLSAFKDAGRTVGHIQKTLTDPDEQRAHAALQVMGALDKTQAHNLAGIAEGGLQGYNPAWSKAMEIIGWGFHKTEVINRETTGMAAYRLARAAGESFDQAIKTASDAIWDTHFDYSNANRARFMQSGAAKVLLMFRQYSLNMTWHLGRMVWQATKGQSPEVKKLARRNLAGILGMSAIFSGTVGLPMAGVIMGTLNALQASFGDDDEPWDAATEFRAFLVDMLGEGAAEILLHGGVNAVTGADIAGRTGLSEMWFRDADKELEGRGYYYSLLEQAAGPMGGVLKNAIVGKNMIDEGHAWRGVETMLPKALKDMMKGARYATQGVNTLRGDPLVADSSLFDALLQVNGFTPAQVASQYDRNRQLGNYEQAILDRRSALMDGFAMALRTGDNEARAALVTKIQAFNSKNPEVAISSAGIRRSIQARARYSAKAEAGMVINQKLKRRLTERVPD